MNVKAGRSQLKYGVLHLKKLNFSIRELSGSLIKSKPVKPVFTGFFDSDTPSFFIYSGLRRTINPYK